MLETEIFEKQEWILWIRQNNYVRKPTTPAREVLIIFN